MNFLKSLFKKPVTICFLIIISIVLGIVSTSSMAVNLLPDISFPYLAVQTVYVGADAETIDKTVTAPLEKSLSSISDIHDLSTYSADNGSVIILQFEYGTNIDDKEDEIYEKISALTLPDGCGEPKVLSVDLNSASISTITIYSKDNNVESIYEQVNDLSEKILAISGVGSIKTIGAPTQNIKITTINGLEMFAALIANDLNTDHSLDIPLGEIIIDGEKISVNNQTSAKTIDEIKNLTIGLELNEGYIQTFTTAQNTIIEIEEMNSDTLIKMKQDADNMNAFINLLENSSDEELDKLSNNLSMIKSIISLLENYSASTLKMMWSTTLSPLFENEDFKNLNEEELHDLANDLNVSYELLKWMQDNSEINPETNKTYAEEKWDILVEFKKAHPDVITDEEYITLFYDLNIVSNNVEDENYMSEEEIINGIQLSRNINTVALNDVVTTLKNDEVPSNNQYAALFIYNGNEYTIPLTGTTIGIIRSQYFEHNYEVFYQYKLEHEHEEEIINEETNEVTTIIVGDKISSSDFMMLYNSMKFEEEFELKPTERLIDFIRDVNFTNDSIKIKVHQIADVELITSYESSAYYNSYSAIQLKIYGNSGSNATEIVENTQKIIDELNNNNDNFEIVMLNNQANFINESLENALISLLIGGLLAIVVIYLFLRKVKSSLIIGISMPLSILCTLVCLYAMGITLNMVSVGGIAVGIGMLVDNSIVVLESISSEKEKGKDVFKAAYDGVKLVLGSLIGSTLTSICVFFPILLNDGLTKEIFSDLSWAVIFSLTFSLIVAVVVIPTLFCLFYKKKNINKNNTSEGKLFIKLKNWYIKILNKLLKRKYLTVLVSMLIFMLSIGLIFTSSIEFLPSIDQHRIQLTIDYKADDSTAYCQETTLEAYNLIQKEIKDIKHISTSVGYTGFINTNQTGTILIQLEDNAKKTADVVEDIRILLNNQNYEQDFDIQELDGVVASLTGGIAGVSITLYGEDVNTLQEIVAKVENDVVKKEGIRKASNDMLSNQTSYTIDFDKDKLVEYGLDYTTIVATLRIGLAGYDVFSLTDNVTEFKVNVTWKEDTLNNYYDGIDKLIIGFDQDGNVIHLEDVSTITEEYGRYIIRKANGLNTVSISVESYGIDTNTASKHLQNSVKNILKDYEGYSYQSGGVSYYLSDAFSGLFIALIISFILLYGIMACLFESLRKPIIIIFSFPFAFTGGFIALALSGVSLNVVSFVGFIMLMGVIVNDAIVLNERFDQLKNDEKLNPKQAVIDGCKQRLRAVLMTTLTTVLALIPMALGQGKGGELMQPLGVVAIGGMCVGTVVTLILIPCVYSIIYKIDYNK